MSRERLKLHEKLVAAIGNNNVYYQPPENFKMKYPCIRYQPNRVNIGYADNKAFTRFKGYIVTFIHKDPDSDVNDHILDIEGVRFDRNYTADDLIHDVYEINFI